MNSQPITELHINNELKLIKVINTLWFLIVSDHLSNHGNVFSIYSLVISIATAAEAHGNCSV